MLIWPHLQLLSTPKLKQCPVDSGGRGGSCSSNFGGVVFKLIAYHWSSLVHQ